MKRSVIYTPPDPNRDRGHIHMYNSVFDFFLWVCTQHLYIYIYSGMSTNVTTGLNFHGGKWDTLLIGNIEKVWELAIQQGTEDLLYSPWGPCCCCCQAPCFAGILTGCRTAVSQHGYTRTPTQAAHSLQEMTNLTLTHWLHGAESSIRRQQLLSWSRNFPPLI
jgi:hypothetical protein